MIAIAGASEGHRWLVVIGLLISIPVVVWGSTLFIRVLNRFPWIVYLGGGVLAYTAAKMIAGEKAIEGWMERHAWAVWMIQAVVIAGVLLAGYTVNTARKREAQQAKSRAPH